MNLPKLTVNLSVSVLVSDLKYCCIALAGVAQEYIDHGNAEGGMNDILQLDYLLNGLGFSQKKADDQIRWAALNTVLVLKQNQGVINALARNMSEEASLTKCILSIEENLEDVAIVAEA